MRGAVTPGRLPPDWRWATLADLATVSWGQTPGGVRAHVAPSGAVPWFKVGDLGRGETDAPLAGARAWLDAAAVPRLGLRVFPAGTVVFPRRGNAIASNRKRRLGRPGCCDVNLMAVVPRPGLADYLWWWFAGLDLAALVTGSTVPQISGRDLSPLPVPLPPAGERRQIVTRLGELLPVLATAVTALEHVRGNLERFRTSVLDVAFTGRLTAAGRSPKPGPQGGGRLGAPDPRPLPAGWRWATLAQVCAVIRGGSHRSPADTDRGVLALRPRDVAGGELGLATAASEDECRRQTGRVAPAAGDVVYSRDHGYGWAAEVPAGVRLGLAQGMVLLRPAPDVRGWYLRLYLNGPEGRAQVRRAAAGSAHPHLTLGAIRAFRIPVPPVAEQDRIVTAVAECVAAAAASNEQVAVALSRAAGLRRSLLERAFTGRLVAPRPVCRSVLRSRQTTEPS